MTVTFAELKLQARERADMVNTDFIEDAELGNFINSSTKELHDILIQAYDSEYFLKTYEFVTAGSVDQYALPSDFYKLGGVDVKLNGSDWFNIKKFNFNARNRYQHFGAWTFFGRTAIKYRLVGPDIKFSPIPDNGVDVRLWYHPSATTMVDDSDTFDGINGFEEYIIVDAAIKMLQKEESDVTVLMAQKQALKRRIEEAANNRDAANADSITDIHEDNNDAWYWRSRG